jgi:hypothetical protein
MTPILALSATPPQAVGWIALGCFLLILLLLSVLVFPQYLVNRTIALRKEQQPLITEYLKAENDVRTTLLQAIGAAGAALAVIITWQQYQATLARNHEDLDNSQKQLKVSQNGQITDRFTHAIDQLGSRALVVRVGGIYALERIVNDSRGDYEPIMEVLTTFVRERAPWPPAKGVPSPKPPGTQSPKPKPPADIQAVLTVLGRRPIPKNWHGPNLHLSQTGLRGASLYMADLTKAVLFEAHLEGADLTRAHLDDANLTGAHLDGANLTGAHLDGAILSRVHLDGANFSGADLTRADLRDTLHLDKALNLTKEQLATALR